MYGTIDWKAYLWVEDGYCQDPKNDDKHTGETVELSIKGISHKSPAERQLRVAIIDGPELIFDQKELERFCTAIVEARRMMDEERFLEEGGGE